MTRQVSPVYCDFTVVIDNNEQHPYHFTSQEFSADSRQKYRPLIIPTVIRSLNTGDYSIDGLEHLVTVERKSLADFYSTLGQNRDRFERELLRMSEMDFGAVVVEADWPSIIERPPPNSELLPKTVYRSVIAWQQRFPNVHWWACATRSFAERTTFRILERYYRDYKDGLKDVKPVGQVG